MYRVVTTNAPCDSCGGTMRIRTGQTGTDRLHAHRSFRCESCGLAIEEDLPWNDEAVREALISEFGEHCLVVCHRKDLHPARMSFIAMTGMSLRDIARLSSEIPACAGRGTVVEMEFLQERLAKRNITSKVRRVDTWSVAP